MKRLAMIVLILGILQLPVTAFAAEREKAVSVELSTVPDEINLGDSITVEASMQKHGSTLEDDWINADKVSTEYNEETGLYLSTAEFKPIAAGTYEITYQFSMGAGKSGIVFTGKAEKTIIVKDIKTVIGAEVKDLRQSPVKSMNGISGYMVVGNAYALWSDSSETDLNQVVIVFFKPSEVQKEVELSFNFEGTPYSFKTVIQRPVAASMP